VFFVVSWPIPILHPILTTWAAMDWIPSSSECQQHAAAQNPTPLTLPRTSEKK